MPPAAQTGAAPAGTSCSSGSCELADVFQLYGEAYRRSHRLSPHQRHVMRDITRCRTAALGGHRAWCDGCGFERYNYHSCRNRHCPKCQSVDRAAWVEARSSELLPVPYFHHVFTLPHELNPLVQCSEPNQRALLKLLFDATAATLLKFGRGELGGKVGFTLVLHTWDQQLRPHLHVHCIMASGALGDEGQHWIAGGAKFLFPVCGLSEVFRAKYLDGLAELLAEGALDIPPQLAALGTPGCRRRLLRQWRTKPWVAYSKPPFAGPQKLLDYLGRYTHRVAISNHRLLGCDDGQVRFSYRDRKEGDRLKTATLPAGEFIGRFLEHVLPARFLRIRHYGFLANRAKQTQLAQCRRLLGVSPSAHRPRPVLGHFMKVRQFVMRLATMLGPHIGGNWLPQRGGSAHVVPWRVRMCRWMGLAPHTRSVSGLSRTAMAADRAPSPAVPLLSPHPGA